jgi:hypothetical protein
MTTKKTRHRSQPPKTHAWLSWRRQSIHRLSSYSTKGAKICPKCQHLHSSDSICADPSYGSNSNLGCLNPPALARIHLRNGLGFPFWNSKIDRKNNFVIPDTCITFEVTRHFWLSSSHFALRCSTSLAFYFQL